MQFRDRLDNSGGTGGLWRRNALLKTGDSDRLREPRAIGRKLSVSEISTPRSNEAPAFDGLRAMFVNCTLKKSPERSHSQGLADISSALGGTMISVTVAGAAMQGS